MGALADFLVDFFKSSKPEELTRLTKNGRSALDIIIEERTKIKINKYKDPQLHSYPRAAEVWVQEFRCNSTPFIGKHNLASVMNRICITHESDLQQYADLMFMLNLVTENKKVLKAKYDNGNTLLHLAIQTRKEKLVELVINYNPDPYIQNDHLQTAKDLLDDQLCSAMDVRGICNIVLKYCSERSVLVSQ